MAAQMPKSLRIGVMAEAVQLADIMGMDILGSLAKPDVDLAVFAQNPDLADLIAEWSKFADQFVEIQWFYMSSTLEPAPTSLPFKWLPNITYDDCPRDLDIVLTGGPWPTHRPAAADKFIREAWPKTRFWLTTCTGSMWIANSGVLNGTKATGNRAFLPVAKKASPEVDWVEKRWVTSDKVYDGEGKGQVWTAGGAGCGIDMIAAFCLQKFNPDFVNFALAGLDMQQDRKIGQFY